MRVRFLWMAVGIWVAVVPLAGASPGPSATPDSLVEAIAAAGDSASWPGAGVVVVLDRTEVDVEESGLGHVRRRVLRKVLTEMGARDEATLRFDYDPASNFIRIDSIRIHRANATTMAVDPATAVDLPAPAHLIYWGARMKVLSLPRLQVGDAIETETYKKGFQIAYLEGDGAVREGTDDERYIPPMRGHFYDVVTFQDAVPMKEKRYLLRTPRHKPVQYTVYNGALESSLRFAPDALVYSWEADDVPALESEPRMPDLTDVVPKVVLATVENWPEKSRWFFDVNEPVFDANDAIRRKVAEITRGLKDDDEKMAALLHWVAQEIRYSGISMGKGEGYTLHPGVMTFEDRCGVCKDIAGMLVTMLRAAGYTTYPVMTMAGARVEAVPADQFNHCVVAVERPDGSFTMLDPTWAPFSRAVWSRWEGEQHIVIGSPDGEGLSAIRSFTPEESRLRIEGRGRLREDGLLEGSILFTGVGISDGRLRSSLADAPAWDRRMAITSLLAPLGPAVEVTGYDATDPRDFSTEASIRVAYRVPRYSAVGDSLLVFLLPAVRVAAENARLTRLLAFRGGSSDRKHEALLWAPQEVVVEEILDLPRDFRPLDETDSLKVEGDASLLRCRYAPTGGRIRAELTATVKKRTIPAGEWAGGVEAADSLSAFGLRPRWARRGR